MYVFPVVVEFNTTLSPSLAEVVVVGARVVVEAVVVGASAVVVCA